MTHAVTVPVPAAKQRQLDAESNALLQVLVASSPAQILTYMQANTGTPAQTAKVLAALATAVKYLYLRGN